MISLNKMRSAILIIIVFFLPSVALSAHKHPESYYQGKWCRERGGTTEQVLPDGTRADCTTPANIIEFDFDTKWAESLGQALHYSQQTGKRAGIVLIMEHGGKRHMKALTSTIEHFHLPVDVWEMGQ